MNKKIITIGIIYMFLLTGSTAIAFPNIEDIENFKKQNIECNGYNSDFSQEHEVVNYTSENEDIGDFDIKADIVSWWSPFPWIEDKEARCLQVYVKREGFYQSEDIHLIYIRVYWINSTGVEELIISKTVQYGGGFYFLSYIGLLMCTVEEKPVEARVEVETLIPESNKENNVKTVTVGLGVTIDGYVYTKNIFGEKNPLNLIDLYCLADEPHFLNYYYHTKTCDDLLGGGHYVLYAPMKPGSLPQTFTVQAKYGKRSQRKTTKPLYEFENTTMEDFVFLKLKDKPVALKFTNILTRFIDQHPLMFPKISQVLVRLLNLR